jgi:hypothetical protein
MPVPSTARNCPPEASEEAMNLPAAVKRWIRPGVVSTV